MNGKTTTPTEKVKKEDKNSRYLSINKQYLTINGNTFINKILQFPENITIYQNLTCRNSGLKFF
jgi:hypothetical protein